MSPWFGQGGTACIEDAAELGNTLYSIFSESQKVKEALQAYRSRREKRTQEIAKFSADFGRLYSAQLPYGLGGIVRGLLFGYVPSNIWLWWLKWLYGYQPILRGLDVSGSEVDK
jgi:salicylate hydroxylase